jgi:hypothetical protein
MRRRRRGRRAAPRMSGGAGEPRAGHGTREQGAELNRESYRGHTRSPSFPGFGAQCAALFPDLGAKRAIIVGHNGHKYPILRSACARTRRRAPGVLCDPVFPRWTLSQASAATSGGELTHPQERLQRFPPQKRRRKPRHRGLSRPHKTLLLRSAPEIRPPSTHRTAGDGFRTRLVGRTTSPRGTRRASGR